MRRLFLFSVLLLIATVGCVSTHSATAPPSTPPAALTAAPMEQAHPGFAERTLPNGLKIMCQENHAVPVATVQVHVRAGSLFEEEYLGCGISHLCEHLVHSSTTAKRTGEQSEQLLNSIGAETNAATSMDSTYYYIQAQSKDLPIMLDLLSDWVLNAQIPQKEFDREKSVVQREIEMDDAQPGAALWNLAARTTFQVHPMQFPVIGYKELFVRLTRDDVLKYYHRMYTPDHMVVVAVGDFDAAKTVDDIAAMFGNAPRGNHVVPMPQDDPPQMGLRTANEDMDVISAYMTTRFRTIPLSHPDLYALDVLSFILGNGNTSRLFQRLHEDRPLVESVDASSFTPSTGAGSFDITTVSTPQNVEKIKEIIRQEIRKIKDQPVSAEELDRAKKQFIAYYIFARQSVDDQASDLASNYLSCGNPFLTEFYLNGIRSVTAEQIQQVARRYFNEANETICTVQPPQEQTETAALKKQSAFPPQKIVLPNGLRVLIQRNPAVPIVSVQAFFPGGLIAEPNDAAGLAKFYAYMLTRGTATRNAYQIARTFDDIGGSLSGESGRNTCSLQAQVLSSDLERGLAVFSDCLLNPAFPKDEIEKAKTLFLAQQESQQDELYVRAHLTLMKALFGSAPYSRDPLGTPESIRKIDQNTLLAFHRRVCTSQAVVAIYGDIDPERARQLALQYFGGIPKSDAAPAAIPEPAPLTDDQMAKEETGPELEAAMLQIAYRTCESENQKDAIALAVLDTVMSGTDLPSGWLHNELRGKGLVYVVHAVSIPGFRTPGWFEIYAQIRPEKIDEVIAVIDKNIERAKTTLVSPEELEQAKRKLLAAELLARQTNEARGQDAAVSELQGFGYNHSDSFAGQVNAVTASEVQRVAKKYFTKRAVVILQPQKAEAEKN